MTAPSRELLLPAWVCVTNLENGHRVVVTVNDRGPFAPNRIIDLSYAAARQLGMIHKGTAPVAVLAIASPAPPTALERAPVPVQVPATRAAIRASTAPRLYLQLGAFSSLGNAERRARLAARGLAPLLVQTGSAACGELPLYRARLGPLADVPAIDAAAEHMRVLGIKGFRVAVV